MATPTVTPVVNNVAQATPVADPTTQPQQAPEAAASTPAANASALTASTGGASIDPPFDPSEESDEGLTAHTQLALQSAPYALKKWLDIPNIKATKEDAPTDAENYTGGRLPQSGVNEGDTDKVRVYNGHNYTNDQFGNKSSQFPVHEAVHMLQNKLPKSFTSKFPAEDKKNPYKDLQLTADDLNKMRKNGDTFWKHSREGQASLMQKYVARHEWLEKQATPQEAHEYMTNTGQFKDNGNAHFEQAYAPYLDDVANAPVPKGSYDAEVNETSMKSPQLSASYAVHVLNGHPSMDGVMPGEQPQSSTSGEQDEYSTPIPQGASPSQDDYSTPIPQGASVSGNGGSSNPLAITQDPNSTISGGVQELNSVGAGIGEGLLNTLNGGADLLHLPHATLEARQKELETNNAQNPTERALGYGGETLMELISGDEALKGLSFADKLDATSKIAKVLEKSPRLTRALKVGSELLAKTGKVGEAATDAASAGARIGTVQGAQTLDRTGGDVGAAAKQGAIAGVTGGATEGLLGAVGSGLRDAGDTADGVKDLTTVAKNTASRPEVVQSVGNRLQAADALRHSEYETGLNNMAEQSNGATVDAANNPLAAQAKELLKSPVPSEHPIVAQAADVEGDKLDKGVRGLLESIANGGVKDEEATEAAAKPTGLTDDKGNPISSGNDGEDVVTPSEPYSLKNLVALRQRIRSIASGYDYGDVNSRALRSLINAPDGKVAPLDQAIDKLMEDSGNSKLSGDYKDLRNTYRTKQRAFENPVVQKLMNSVDKDGNLTPKAVTDAANDFITQAKTEGGPLAGKKAGNIEALKTALGPDDLHDFGKQIVHNMLQDSATKGVDGNGNKVMGEVNPAKFMRTWNKISAETKGGGLFDLTPESDSALSPATLGEAQKQWATSTNPAKRGVSRLLNDAHSAARLQTLTKAGIIGAGGTVLGAVPLPIVGKVGSDLGMGLLGMLGVASETGGIKTGRNILDYISDHPAVWATYRKLGNVAASKAASGAADVARVAAAHSAAEGISPTPDRKSIKDTYKSVAGSLGGSSTSPKSDGSSSDSNDELPAQKMHPVLQKVLREYPGLAKNFNAANTSLVFANGSRAQRGSKERGGLEFWSPNDAGTSDFPSPEPGKNVLEIYSDTLKHNPSALKEAVYGDLMHGMSADPYWKGLRDQFMQSFTPQEKGRQSQHKTWWDDVNHSKTPLGSPTYDAYIRGWIANEGEGKKGQADSGNTMYSPKQIQILQKMQDYLKTGQTR